MNFNATLIGQMIAFAIFVWFCMKYVWPPIMAALEDRQKQIADGLAAATHKLLPVGIVARLKPAVNGKFCGRGGTGTKKQCHRGYYGRTKISKHWNSP